MRALVHGRDRSLFVQRMRSADDGDLGVRQILASLYSVSRGEGLCTGGIDIHDRYKLGFGKPRQRLRMQMRHLTATNDGSPQTVAHCKKYSAHIRRRKLSDSAISSIPFTPSSM